MSRADLLPCVVLETKRLVLRHFVAADASFIVALLGEPDFVRFIGDKGVRTLDDARRYIDQGPRRSYAQLGFGLYLVQRRADGVALGMCGLLKRESLPDVDLGFAFLAEHRGRGYALEAAAAVLDHGRRALELPRVVAIASPDNARSIHLLAKLGLRFDRMLDGEPATALFSPSDPAGPA